MEFLKKLFGFGPETDWDEVRKSLEPKIADLRKPAVRLVKSDTESKSRLGGRPLVESKHFSWPESNGNPMAFLAQIDLSEISVQVPYEWLNKKGLVLFFYDVLEMPWGFDPKDRGKWKVIFQENPGILADLPDSIDEISTIKESYITAKRVEVLPNYDDPGVESLNLSDEEIELYIDLEADCSDDEPLHQVGGFPSPVQGNDMELESQLASNGVYVGNSKGYQSPEAKALEDGARDWKLLFQFDSDDVLDVMWGDCGMLYFWVQQEKSIVNQFENSWLILQCS